MNQASRTSADVKKTRLLCAAATTVGAICTIVFSVGAWRLEGWPAAIALLLALGSVPSTLLCCVWIEAFVARKGSSFLTLAQGCKAEQGSRFATVAVHQELPAAKATQQIWLQREGKPFLLDDPELRELSVTTVDPQGQETVWKLSICAGQSVGWSVAGDTPQIAMIKIACRPGSTYQVSWDDCTEVSK